MMPVDTWRTDRARCSLCGWIGPQRYSAPWAAQQDLERHQKRCPEENALLTIQDANDGPQKPKRLAL